MATVFTVQVILVIVINILVWLLSPTLIDIYKLSSSQIWLLRATALCLLVTSFKTIPSALLQRDLLYQKTANSRNSRNSSLQCDGNNFSFFRFWSLEPD